MSAVVNAGPFISAGNCIAPTTASGLAVGAPEQNPDAGPSMSYQGDCILDPRFYVQKDYMAGRNGIVLSHLNAPYLFNVDRSPQTLAAAGIAAAQAAVANTPLTFAAASAGISTNVPFLPFKSQILTTAPIALDFGFLGSTVNAAVDTLSINGTATATASSLLAASNFYPGQWLIIPNAGATATAALITCVLSVSGTTITFATGAQVPGSSIPGQTSTIAQVGTANIPNTSWTGSPAPVAAFPYLAGGAAGILDPKQCCMRAVSVTANAGATVTTMTITGWDVYGQPQTEAITVSAGATVNGKKTWKYIAAATPNSTDAGHTYSIGTLDIFGFVVRVDRFEYANIFMAGSYITASTGFTAADLTSPATTTTGDVRGTYAVQTATDGIRRLGLFCSIPAYNLVAATPANPTPLYGQFPV